MALRRKSKNRVAVLRAVRRVEVAYNLAFDSLYRLLACDVDKERMRIYKMGLNEALREIRREVS